MIPLQGLSAPNDSWNDEWSYFQEIDISIDTSKNGARFQPIDQEIQFQNPCWGTDEISHSIRIICLFDETYYELESQIYEIISSDDATISSCRVVFLIPEFADGSESYYVYYDDSEKPDISYQDHVSIDESYYRYEPISGYPLESYYYKIMDDDAIPYTVSQEGQLMGYNTGQHVVKMLENITEVHPKNGDLFAAFDFRYSYDNGLFDYSSTSQKLISKEVFIDGNLMISFGMVSTSRRDDLLTTVNYKYYHCPTATTRMRAHVTHEVLDDATTLEKASTDGIFASLQSGGVKSNSIKDLNIGEILPNLHFKNEFNEINSYDMDIDPEYIPGDPDIRIASYKDDVDLGEEPWICFNEGETGLAHGLLFHSNQVIVSGNDERDGLQLNAFQMDYPHLPGLENNIATVQIGRNSYEPESGHDIFIPEKLIVEFDAEFFTSPTNGLPAIKQEVDFYNSLINDASSSNDEYDNDESSEEKHDIEVIITQAPSFPFGSALSAISGLNLSFITAELYKDDVYLSSETAVRVPMNALDQEATDIVDMIKAGLGIIDYQNISLRKKVEFSDMKPGNYTIKLFLENKFLSSERQYIGFTSIVLESEDMRIKMNGGPQQMVNLIISDQDEKPVKNAKITLEKNNAIVNAGMTDEEGMIGLSVPRNADPYDLKISLQGVQCYQDQIDFSLLSRRMIKKEIAIERYDIILELQDEWGLTPGVEISPLLFTSKGENLGSFEKISEANYQFTSLPSDQYQIIIKYKAVTLTKEIDLSKDIDLSLTFPARFQTTINVLDNHGLGLNDITFIINRDGIQEEMTIDDNVINFMAPPGQYNTKIIKDDTVIAQRNLQITGDETYDYVTSNEPFYPLLVIIVLFGLLIGLSYNLYLKNRFFDLIKIIPIILVLVSLILPWWGIQGSYQSMETQTQLFFIPTSLITVTSSPDVLIGDQGYLPDIFFTMVYGIIGMIIATIVCIIITMFLKHRKDLVNFIISLLPIIFLIGVIGVFIFGMSSLSEISVGTFIGSGPLDVSVGGQEQFQQIPSQWGPSIGFYVIIISLFIYSLPFMNKFKNRMVNRFEKQ